MTRLGIRKYLRGFVGSCALTLLVCGLAGIASAEAVQDKIAVQALAYGTTGGTETVPRNSKLALPESPDAEDKVFDKEIIEKLGKLLQSKGYIITDLSNSDYVIVISYSVESGTNIWEASSNYSIHNKDDKRSFTHNIKRKPHPYLGELRLTVLTKEQYSKPRTFVRENGFVRYVETVCKAKVANYKAIIDYCLLVASRKFDDSVEGYHTVILDAGEKI